MCIATTASILHPRVPDSPILLHCVINGCASIVTPHLFVATVMSLPLDVLVSDTERFRGKAYLPLNNMTTAQDRRRRSAAKPAHHPLGKTFLAFSHPAVVEGRQHPARVSISTGQGRTTTAEEKWSNIEIYWHGKSKNCKICFRLFPTTVWRGWYTAMMLRLLLFADSTDFFFPLS